MKKALVLLFAAVLLFSSSAVASAPSSKGAVNVNDSGATTAALERLHVVGGDNSYLFLASNPQASDGAFTVSGGGYYCFYGFGLTNATVTQTFCLRSQNANMTLTAIHSYFVENTVTVKSGATPKISFNYTMPAAFASLGVPQDVVYTFGGTTTPIPQASYFTSAGSFAGCAAPCVYQNSANDTLILTAPANTPFTVDWYFPAYGGQGPVVTTTTSTSQSVSTGGGQVGCGGCGSTNPTPTSSTTSSGGTTPPSIGSTTQIAVVIMIAVVFVALLIGVTSRSRNPFRQPEISAPKFQLEAEG